MISTARFQAFINLRFESMGGEGNYPAIHDGWLNAQSVEFKNLTHAGTHTVLVFWAQGNKAKGPKTKGDAGSPGKTFTFG